MTKNLCYKSYELLSYDELRLTCLTHKKTVKGRAKSRGMTLMTTIILHLGIVLHLKLNEHLDGNFKITL